MIVVMKPKASEEQIQNVISYLNELGLTAHLSRGEILSIIGVIGDKRKLLNKNAEMLDGVDSLVPITETYKLANKKFKQTPTKIKVGKNINIGEGNFVIMAGPCAVESREQLLEIAIAVKACGAQILRGGAYKPRTSPYSFQGLEEEGLKYMDYVRKQTGLAVVTEVTSEKAVETAVDYVDILQIGARNMQNFTLLKEVGKTKLPVLLKRGLAATIDEWLNAAEYILNEGNPNVIFCERGIRTFEPSTRNTLDISAVPVIKQKSHLPIIVDPSHATGFRDFVPSLTKASLAAGADGVIVEVHPNPAKALSDGPQSLDFKQFAALCGELKPLAQALGKDFFND